MELAVLLSAVIGGLLGSVIGPLLKHWLTRRQKREEAIWHHRHKRFEEMIRTAGELTGLLLGYKAGEQVEEEVRKLYHMLGGFAHEFYHLESIRRAVFDVQGKASPFIGEPLQDSKEEAQKDRDSLKEAYECLVRECYDHLEVPLICSLPMISQTLRSWFSSRR